MNIIQGKHIIKSRIINCLTFVCTIITVGQSERQNYERGRTNSYAEY